MTVKHLTCRKGRDCLTKTPVGGPAVLGPPPWYSRFDLCAWCFRAQYKHFPWPGDPRDEPDHPDYVGG